MNMHNPVTDADLFDKNAMAMARDGIFAELRPESPSWEEWRTYFRFISHDRMLTVMRAHENRAWGGKGGVMVPAEWPRDFDPRAPKAPPKPERSVKQIESDAYRADVVRRLLSNWNRHP